MDQGQLGSGAAMSLGVAIFGSLPAFRALILRTLRKKQQQPSIYEDADGKSTAEVQQRFSTRLPRFLVIFSSSAGFASSLAVAILSTQRHLRPSLFWDHWFNAGTWGFLLIQGVAIASSRECVQAYRLGIYSFLTSIVLFGSLVLQATRIGEHLLHHDVVMFSLCAFQVFFILVLSLSSTFLQRRPDVFDEDGRAVDRMYTVSAFIRFNYSWPSHILRAARRKGDLEQKDLGRPNHYLRARNVSADWKRRGYKTRLWLSIIRSQGSSFMLQWLLTLVTSVLNFLPQWVILQILRRLEQRATGTAHGLDIWMWVFWLGAAIVAQNWVESYLFWLSWSELSLPIRVQLSCLVFEKAMRRKDAKDSTKSSNKDPASEATAAEQDPVMENGARVVVDCEQEEEDKDETEAIKKTKQGTVNLIGVDAYRIGDFAAYQNLFPGSLFKLIVSLTFLVSLLGWKPLIAGFSTMLAIMPLNIYASKSYAAAQDRLMKVRDEKLAVVTEALQGIRQIKFSALEPEWEKKVDSVRSKELRCVWNVFKTDTALIGCWVTSPILLSAVSLAAYAYINGELTPSVAFVSLSIFKALEMTLSVVPELTTDLLDAWVSVNRLEEYLNSPEIEPVAQESDEIRFENASIAWPSDNKIDESQRFVLRDVNVTFPQGELSVVSGKTGTGKSLLLAAILGEVELLSGSIYRPHAPPAHERHDDKINKANWIIPGAIAYVAQIPWIENASIRDNILFGLPFDPERYQKTIEVCALKKDLEILTDGESTEIGANGINLSGGQKWRVTLARAIYSRAGILVLDDIFSAVDAHVGRHIFEQCLTSELAMSRTRVLVTHHVALCESKAKYMVELGDGRVLYAGLVEELRENGVLEQIKSHLEQNQDDGTAETRTAVNSDDSEESEPGDDANTLRKVPSKVVARKLVEDELRAKGSIDTRIYWVYLKASGGWFFWTIAFAIFVMNPLLNLGRSWWLKKWTDEGGKASPQAFVGLGSSSGLEYLRPYQPSYPHLLGSQIHSLPPEWAGSHAVDDNQGGSRHSLQFYLGIYILLSLSSAFFATTKFLYVYTGSIRASRALFRQMNFAILHAPLRWLDTVPVGRVLNRFTADFNVVDSQLANAFSSGMSSFLGLWVIIVAATLMSPLVVFFALLLLAACLYVALYYLSGARPVKRLESNAKSPVFEQFGSALSGVTTIRGFAKTQTYIERIYSRIDDYSTASWHLWLFNRWMGWRMACVGSMFAVFVAAMVLATTDIDPGLAGFALAFSLEFASSIIWTIRFYATLELNMNAAERIVEYVDIKTETLEGERPPAAWPTNGRIEVDSLVVGYAPDLPPVLKGLSFEVEARQRIGVVGRTGAGKSSLTLALFRFLEARQGKVLIDGIDISTIRLHDLRSRLSIIPQDPILFSGTVRSNLDPFGHHTDAELWESLLRVHLISETSATATPLQGAAESRDGSTTTSVVKNINIFSDLSSPISEGGLNLSQGQRQLLCLARAIVSKPRVMVLDEATSAVDMQTDALIQRSIREEFTDATLVVIAHRLSTIADFDKILVLGDGTVLEYGTPKELWEKGEDGVFRGMCEESGERDKLEGIVLG